MNMFPPLTGNAAAQNDDRKIIVKQEIGECITDQPGASGDQDCFHCAKLREKSMRLPIITNALLLCFEEVEKGSF